MAALGMSAFEACGYSLITKPTVSLPHVLATQTACGRLGAVEMLIVLTDMSVLGRNGPLLADNTRCPGCDGAKPFKLGPGGRAERLGRPEFDDKRVLVALALNGHGLEVASVKR